MKIELEWISKVGGEEKVKAMALDWMKDYARMCRVPLQVAINCAVVSDAGPYIQQGTLLLKRDLAKNTQRSI
jgi:hypothetical protein